MCYDKFLGVMIVVLFGVGKIVCVVLLNLLILFNSCIIIDIKGELRDKIVGYR